MLILGFPHSSVSKKSACNAGGLGSIPGSGRPPGKGNGNPLHYSCLENPMDREAWQAIVYGLTAVRYDLVTKPPPNIPRVEKYRCIESTLVCVCVCVYVCVCVCVCIGVGELLG